MVLEVSTTKRDGTILFRRETEYRNMGLSRKGEPAAAAWIISSYSEEMSTALRPLQVRRETFRVPLTGSEGSEVRVHVKLYSHHGLPTEFGKPAGGELVLEAEREMKL